MLWRHGILSRRRRGYAATRRKTAAAHRTAVRTQWFEHSEQIAQTTRDQQEYRHYDRKLARNRAFPQGTDNGGWVLLTSCDALCWQHGTDDGRTDRPRQPTHIWVLKWAINNTNVWSGRTDFLRIRIHNVTKMMNKELVTVLELQFIVHFVGNLYSYLQSWYFQFKAHTELHVIIVANPSSDRRPKPLNP